MKLLYFHQHFSTPQGATGIRSYKMAQRLISRGHTVTMVCGSYGGGQTGLHGPFKKGRREGRVDGIRIIEFELDYSNSDDFFKRSLIFTKFAMRGIGLALVEKYDLIFTTSTPLTAALPGIAARWLRAKRFVFEVRDLWPELPREMGVIKNPLVLAAMSLLEWSAYKSAHALVGLSPGIARGIESLNVNANRIAMIPNGCDLGIFADGKIEPWRPKNVSPTDLMVIYSGTHGVANGLNAVLDVASKLKQHGRNDIKLVLIGQGRLKSELMQRAAREELDNVVFLDPVSKQRLAGLLASADVGMQLLANVPAFYYGTSPNKFFDYIAAGLPVLNNYPGWLADMIVEHDCGVVVPPENPEAFAGALQQLADHREQLPQMRSAARQLANIFDREKLAEEFVSWLEANSETNISKAKTC